MNTFIIHNPTPLRNTFEGAFLCYIFCPKKTLNIIVESLYFTPETNVTL